MLSKRRNLLVVQNIIMFQRLMVIPQEEYMQLTSVQQARQPLTQQFYDLEKRYQDGERILEPYKRLLSQSETLDHLKALKEKMRQGIVVSTPKPYQSRAKTLYQNLESHVKFNDRGEIYDDDNVIPNSHLDELIQYAVRDRRRKNVVPVAWDKFKSLLKRYNVPRHVLNRDTIMEMDVSGTSIPSSTMSTSTRYPPWELPLSLSPKSPPKSKGRSLSTSRRMKAPEQRVRAAKTKAKTNLTMQMSKILKKRVKTEPESEYFLKKYSS